MERWLLCVMYLLISRGKMIPVPPASKNMTHSKFSLIQIKRQGKLWPSLYQRSLPCTIWVWTNIFILFVTWNMDWWMAGTGVDKSVIPAWDDFLLSTFRLFSPWFPFWYFLVRLTILSLSIFCVFMRASDLCCSQDWIWKTLDLFIVCLSLLGCMEWRCSSTWPAYL